MNYFSKKPELRKVKIISSNISHRAYRVGTRKSFSNAGNLSTYDRSFLDIFKKGGTSKEYVGAVFNAIEIHGFYFSKAKFRVYSKDGTKTTELIDHPFTTLFKQPNSKRTWWEYAYKIPAYWGLWGVNYFHVKRNTFNKEPFAYQQIPPALIEKHYNAQHELDYYLYNDGTNKIEISIQDILEIKYPNPYSEDKGCAIIETVADQQSVNALQMHYMKKFFENGGFMGLIFTTKQEMRKPNYDRVLAMLNEKFMGSDQAYKEVGLFDSGLEPVKAAYSINDMGIAESRKITKDDIYEAWKVSKIHVGSGELANRAANDAVIYQFTSGVIDPLLSFLDNTFTMFIKKEFPNDNIEVIHDTLAPKDVASQVTYYKEMCALGALTINEVRAYEGENAFEYELADKPIINVGGSIVRIDTGKQIGVEDAAGKGQNQSNTEDDSSDSDTDEGKSWNDGEIRKGLDEDWKVMRWKQYDRRLGLAVRRFEKRIGRYFDEQERRILEATLNNFVVGEAFNLQDENMLLHQLLEIDLWDIMKEGHKYGSFQYDNQIGFDKGKLQKDFDGITNNTLNINSTTLDQIKNAKNADELKKAYRQIKDSRLEMISVTTANGALNAGLLQAMRDAGLKTKMWLSMRDAKVRTKAGGENHKIMDGVTVDLDTPFEVPSRTGKDLMMYPSDSTGSPENIVRDRCTIIGR
jgi:HK97 family phage portal protein